VHMRRRDPRCVEPPQELAARVRAMVLDLGPGPAAKRLRLGRDTTLAIAGGLPVMRGTVALAQASLARVEGLCS
jgi:hypothetical protein